MDSPVMHTQNRWSLYRGAYISSVDIVGSPVMNT